MIEVISLMLIGVTALLLILPAPQKPVEQSLPTELDHYLLQSLRPQITQLTAAGRAQLLAFLKTLN